MIAYGPVTLRYIEEKDLELLRDLLNDPAIAVSVVDFAFPVSLGRQKEWFEKVYPFEHAERFIIEAEGASVGSLIFTKVDPDNMTGEIGYKIAVPYQGRGYASCAVFAALPYLFFEKGFECITVRHLDSNRPSARILEKAGFKREGTWRKAVFRNGRRMDLALWSLTRDQYLQAKKDKQSVDSQ